MNAQFKKGVLDLIALHVISEGPMTTYDVLVKLRDALDVNENTIYPLLRRLEQDTLISHQKHQGDMGAPRKVFLLTDAGKTHLATLKKDWFEFSSVVHTILGGKNNV